MDILELFKSQLSGSVMERLGSAVGLDAAQAQSIGQAVLPAQVAALQGKASTQAGAQQLLDLAAQLPAEGTQEPLGTPAGLEQMRQSGTALLPQLLGSGMDEQLSRVAAQTGASSSSVQGMMQMTLPLVLGVVAQQASRLGLDAGNLGSLFSSTAGGLGADLGTGLSAAATGLGAAAVGLGGAAAGGLSNAGAGLGNAGAELGGMAGNLGEGVTGAASGLTAGLSKGAGDAAAGIGGAAGTLGAGLGDAAGRLGGAAAGIGGAAAAGLGSAAAGLGSAASGVGAGLSAGLGGAVSGGVNAVGDGVATVGTGAGLDGGVVHSNPALGGRRGLGWLWILPLLLLVLLLPLLLRSAWFLPRSNPVVSLVATFAVTEPANGSLVEGAFTVKGTGTAGQEITISENGQPVSKATVNVDGRFSADLPETKGGDHTYTLTQAGSSEALTLKVRAAARAGAGDGMAGMGAFAVTAPAAGASLPAGAFDLKGTGKAGEELEIFEDGVSLGKVTVGADGTWSLNVPSPAAGAHTYTAKGPGGTELGSFKTTTLAAAASTAACTKDFSLSIKDAQSVAQPFRFGGVGSGKSYTVTVMRGERKIGSKVLPLDATCGYSYTSKPGAGTVTYMVAQTGSADTAGKITLTVK